MVVFFRGIGRWGGQERTGLAFRLALADLGSWRVLLRYGRASGSTFIKGGGNGGISSLFFMSLFPLPLPLASYVKGFEDQNQNPKGGKRRLSSKTKQKRKRKKKEREGDSSYVSLKGLAPHEGGWNPPTVIGSHRFEVWILR
jgi:hypothetical protein